MHMASHMLNYGFDVFCAEQHFSITSTRIPHKPREHRHKCTHPANIILILTMKNYNNRATFFFAVGVPYAAAFTLCMAVWVCLCVCVYLRWAEAGDHLHFPPQSKYIILIFQW